MLKKPIQIAKQNYWMVTTSEDNINNQNKILYLKKEGSIYILPESKRKDFKGWLNTSNNQIYKPGDIIRVDHGTYFDAIYN